MSRISFAVTLALVSTVSLPSYAADIKGGISGGSFNPSTVKSAGPATGSPATDAGQAASGATSGISQNAINDDQLKGAVKGLGKVKMNEHALGGANAGRNPVGDPTGGLGDGSQGPGQGGNMPGQQFGIGQQRGPGQGPAVGGGNVGGGNNPDGGVGSGKTPVGNGFGGIGGERGPGTGPLGGSDVGGGDVGRGEGPQEPKGDAGNKKDYNKGEHGNNKGTVDKPKGEKVGDKSAPKEKTHPDDKRPAGGGNNPTEQAGHTPGDGNGDDTTPSDSGSGGSSISTDVDPNAWRNMRVDPTGGDISHGVKP